jgi:hypothetical protein
MLRRLRTAPAVRLALCAAAVIAIGASFGLHPEPGEAFGASATAFAKSSSPESNHGCMACLNHGQALTSPLSDLLASGSAWTPAPPPADPTSLGRLAAADLPGRSPPFDRS